MQLLQLVHSYLEELFTNSAQLSKRSVLIHQTPFFFFIIIRVTHILFILFFSISFSSLKFAQLQPQVCLRLYKTTVILILYLKKTWKKSLISWRKQNGWTILRKFVSKETVCVSWSVSHLLSQRTKEKVNKVTYKSRRYEDVILGTIIWSTKTSFQAYTANLVNSVSSCPQHSLMQQQFQITIIA